MVFFLSILPPLLSVLFSSVLFSSSVPVFFSVGAIVLPLVLLGFVFGAGVVRFWLPPPVLPEE